MLNKGVCSFGHARTFGVFGEIVDIEVLTEHCIKDSCGMAIMFIYSLGSTYYISANANRGQAPDLNILV